MSEPLPDLPAVPGGWTTRDVNVGDDVIQIALPADPDAILEEFGFEPEEIEAATDQHLPEVRHLVETAKQLHDRLRENTYDYLY